MRLRERFGSVDPRSGRYPLLYGALIGALVVSLVWLMAASVRGSAESEQATDAASAEASDGSTPNEASADPATSRLHRCREVYNAQLDPLLAAAAAMPQWQVHIAAMNKLVLGVITLQQANQFWSQTRVGVREHLRDFTAAVQHFDRRTVHCFPVGSRPPSPPLERCERAVAARNRVLEAARVALGTWATHVRHMEMLRSGMMSPARATQLWLHSWHVGQQEVTRYNSAVQESRGDPAPC
jgi:hypothetical protein